MKSVRENGRRIDWGAKRKVVRAEKSKQSELGSKRAESHE